MRSNSSLKDYDMRVQAAMLAESEEVWDSAYQRRNNAYIEGRSENLEKYKPGVEDMILMFSHKQGGTRYRFPWYERYAKYIDALLEQVLTAP